MKATRHARIKEIIEHSVIETQEELANALREQHIVVTQATVSRDIKELMLIKLFFIILGGLESFQSASSFLGMYSWKLCPPVYRKCVFCTKQLFIFFNLCAHFSKLLCYYNRRNPPIHYIVFATPP